MIMADNSKPQSLLLMVAGAKGAVASTVAVAAAVMRKKPEAILPSLTTGNSFSYPGFPRAIYMTGWDKQPAQLTACVKTHGVLPENLWLDEHARPKQLDGLRRRQEMVCLGYQKVTMDEKARYVLEHFNTVARRYDLMNTLLSFGIHHLWKRTAVKMLELNPGDCVLDVCGGTGDLSILAGRAVELSGQVIVYDINRAMLDVGRHKLNGRKRAKRIRFIQGDAQHLSFSDGHFDAAMVGFGIRNVPRMDQALREMYRVLKPGGKMLCLEFSKPTAPLFRILYDVYSFYIMPLLGEIIVGSRKAYTHLPESIRTFALPEELTAMMGRAGFSQVTTRKLTNGIAVIHVATKD